MILKHYFVNSRSAEEILEVVPTQNQADAAIKHLLLHGDWFKPMNQRRHFTESDLYVTTDDIESENCHCPTMCEKRMQMEHPQQRACSRCGEQTYFNVCDNCLTKQRAERLASH